jgi:hypothetical protein
MVLETRVIRRLALAASAAWLALVLPGPARADDNWWNSMLGMIGMGPNKPANDDAIDYSARPALVVPPKMDLPPPQAAVARPPDWPNDPDAAARRRAEADSRRPAPPTPVAPTDESATDDADQSTQATAAPAANTPNKSKSAVAPSGDFSKSMGLAGGGTSIFSGGGGALDLSNLNLSNWNPFGSTDISKTARTLKVGVEPQREYLTQPPPGYRAPVAVDDSAQGASEPAAAAAPASDNK